MSIDEIQVFPGLEAVKRRPEMYLGEATTLALVKYTLASLVESTVSTVRIEVLRSCGFRIDCDRCLLPTGTSKSYGIEQPVVLQILLALHAPGPRGFAGALPILNALSGYLRVSSVENQTEMTLQASRGGLIEPVALKTVSEPPRTTIEFEPDLGILRKDELDPSDLQSAAMSVGGPGWTVECRQTDERLNAVRIGTRPPSKDA